MIKRALLVASLLLVARPASAQIHWDAAAQVGVQRRFLSNRPTNGDDADFGPTAMLDAHIALLPLLRVGAYLGHDISPNGSRSARQLTWGGVRAKVLSPWPRGTTRAYAFVGFGFDGTYAPSTPGTVTIEGANGNFFEVPFGLGVSYTFWKPWAVVFELGARAGFGFSGNAYRYPGPGFQTSAPYRPGDIYVVAAGEDSFAIGLTIGIMLDK